MVVVTQEHNTEDFNLEVPLMLVSPEWKSKEDFVLTGQVGCFLPQFFYCRKVAYSIHFGLSVLCILFQPGKGYITLFYKNMLSPEQDWK